MQTNKGIIAWFARNSVAANLLMWIILIGGLFSAVTINKEIFPNIEFNYIKVSVAYPGAAPAEIETAINIKVEEAIRDISGVKKVTSTASQGIGNILVEVEDNFKPQAVLDEMKRKIDDISTFPDSIEKPQIAQIEPKNNVIWASVYGDLSRRKIKELAKSIRDDLTKLPAVTQAKVNGIQNYEISIELTKSKLREYHLSFTQVAQAIRNSSLDLPGGIIRAKDGDILLRTKAQAYTHDDFAKIVVATHPDGSRILLQDLATINDTFEEGVHYTRFNGKPAAIIAVTSVAGQNALDISNQVKSYVKQRQASLPANVKLDTWGDLTRYLKSRLNMMVSNMTYGAILVFFVLWLFLEVKLAFWVMMGVPVCFLGAILIMPISPFSLSINMFTMFAFILVLGITVDDAIVIGESVHDEIEQNGYGIENVITGAQKVATPATFGLLTTVAAFIPMLLPSGTMSYIWRPIGIVVILCLIFSLIESKLILPAHLAKIKPKPRNKNPNLAVRLKLAFNRRVQHFINHSYRNFILRCIKQRYSVIALFTGILILSVAMVVGGQIRWVPFPDIPSDFIQLSLQMEPSSSHANTLSTAKKVEKALNRVDAKLKASSGEEVIKDIGIAMKSNTDVSFFVGLTQAENRSIDGTKIASAWRRAIPPLVAVKKLTINASTNKNDSDIAFRLTSDNLSQLPLAAKELEEKLKHYKGVYDITDDSASTTHEIRLAIKPEAQALGLTLADLASQVRYGFFGYEAQRILRDKEEVKVMVRFPLSQRRTIGDLEDMMIHTASGKLVPFSTVASIKLDKSAVEITRIDGRRAVTVGASANKSIVEPSKVVNEIQKKFIPELKAKYPGISSTLDGNSANEQKTLLVLLKGFLFTLLTIYTLMAIPLKSYSQPLIIMSVIPFGIIGALMGHFILGISVSILSLFGVVALAGVVVNDSLILVDFVNRARRDGIAIEQAIIDAGCRRFRPIILTSLTTFIGLAPILLEKSLQAKFVIPMATSLAFGILFSTIVTLILVPILYVLINDVKDASHRVFLWWWQPKTSAAKDD